MTNEDKKTVGEELWLIHLKRHTPTLEDYDVPKRKRAKSIGQELYQIHLKRSQGVSFDSDTMVRYDHDTKSGQASKRDSCSLHHTDEESIEKEESIERSHLYKDSPGKEESKISFVLH